MIKIYGERNSGTRYLKYLLMRNTKSTILSASAKKDGTGWKHGKPDLERIEKPKNVLFICLVRELEAWLDSMFRNPYHIQPVEDFESFCTKKVIFLKSEKIHPIYTNIQNSKFEQNKNLFELRYSKYVEYLKLLASYNCILCSLDFVQKNPKQFLKIVSKFNIKLNKRFQPITSHTKTGQKHYKSNIKNKLEPKVLESYSIPSIETDIKNLEISYNII